MFFACSDWLLKLGIASAINLPAFLWILLSSFSSFLRKKGTVCCWLSTGLVYTKTIIHSVSVVLCCFAAPQISTTIHLCVRGIVAVWLLRFRAKNSLWSVWHEIRARRIFLIMECKKSGRGNINPLSPNSGENEIFVYIITAFLNIQVTRIQETITKDKTSWQIDKFSLYKFHSKCMENS